LCNHGGDLGDPGVGNDAVAGIGGTDSAKANCHHGGAKDDIHGLSLLVTGLAWEAVLWAEFESCFVSNKRPVCHMIYALNVMVTILRFRWALTLPYSRSRQPAPPAITFRILKCDNGVPCASRCSGTGSDGDIGVSEWRRFA
jgi:hypothetical protein